MTTHLVLFDLDGTALKSALGASLSDRLKKAITSSAPNIKYAVATGRSWEHFWPVVTDIANHLQPCIISGGSQIVSPAGDILWQVSLSPKHIDALNSIASAHGKLLAYNGGLRTYDPVRRIEDADPSIIYMLGISAAEIDEIHRLVSNTKGLYAAITNAWGNSSDYALHITHKNANKGTATGQLLSLLGIDSSQVTAIGDGLNDIPMFNMAGKSLAVAGSPVERYEIITGTIDVTDNDGLAKYIEQL